MKLNKWPLDVEELNKGDVLPVERIEEITGEVRGTNGFQFAKMRIASFIEMEREHQGIPVVIKHEGETLRVLTDEEAAIYTETRFHDALRSAGRSHYRQSAYIDTEQLTNGTREKHEWHILVNSRILQAVRKARLEGTQKHKLLTKEKRDETESAE